MYMTNAQKVHAKYMPLSWPLIPRKFFVGLAICTWILYVGTIFVYVVFFYEPSATADGARRESRENKYI